MDDDTALPPLILRGRALTPVVQGGMGIGVSAHRLAAAVARENAVGTISSVDLRRLHPDLMAASAGRCKERIDAANRAALAREVALARAASGGRGMIAVNVMRAVSDYAALVRQACDAGADAIVMGAGLPLDLPDLAGGHPGTALVPILSDARGIAIVLKKWMRKRVLPDAIVIEHPGHAGGHLGAANLADVASPRFEFARVLEDTFALFRELAIPPVPLIPAGGIATPGAVRALAALGAAAVQLGTPFAVTVEGDAHPEFKRVLAEAAPADIVTFMSVAGLPARAVRTPWLARYLERLPVLARRCGRRAACTLAFDCLTQCGLRDGIDRFGQFCIDHHLAAALAGDRERGLFFRGAGPLPFGREIRPVRDLIDFLLARASPGATATATPA